jgi:hypothetical protein
LHCIVAIISIRLSARRIAAGSRLHERDRFNFKGFIAISQQREFTILKKIAIERDAGRSAQEALEITIMRFLQFRKNCERSIGPVAEKF